MSRPLSILLFSTLYPNAMQPQHGLFVEQRLRHLLDHGEAVARVVAPVPWFPWTHSGFGRYARLAGVPEQEWRHGIEILHPRYPVIPRIGMTLAPLLMAAALLPLLRRLAEAPNPAGGRGFDLIDAHYFYPDGVAAAWLGRRLGKPVVITARGTDINLIPRHRLPRHMIRWAARQAAGVAAVSQALKQGLVEIGVPPERVTVLRNGVDPQLFHPVDPGEARRRLDLDGPGPVLAAVGHLTARKGYDRLIRALPLLPPETRVVIAGGWDVPGEENPLPGLHGLARSLGVEERVRFLGSWPQDELKYLYSAADVLVLASSREGWANCLLESMACGTPAAVSPVWGNPEVVAAPEAGRVMADQSPEAIAETVRALLREPPPREAVRRYAERFDWQAVSQGQMALFRQAMQEGRRP
ncbi:MAG: glycosyltransferase [Magnetococcales bacterium]|nr:glycosyltransferase [Magnetococcales bacterium]